MIRDVDEFSYIAMDTDEFGLCMCVRRQRWVVHRGSKGDMVRGGEEEKMGGRKVDDIWCDVCVGVAVWGDGSDRSGRTGGKGESFDERW